MLAGVLSREHDSTHESRSSQRQLREKETRERISRVTVPSKKKESDQVVRRRGREKKRVEQSFFSSLTSTLPLSSLSGPRFFFFSCKTEGFVLYSVIARALSLSKGTKRKKKKRTIIVLLILIF